MKKMPNRITILGVALVALSACGMPPDRAELFNNVSDTQEAEPLSGSIEPTASQPAAATAPPTGSAAERNDAASTPAPEAPGSTEMAPDIAAGQRGEELDAYLRNLAESQQFMGTVLVAVGDDLILDAGYGWADLESGRMNTPQTQLRIGSLTKQITAAAVLRLQELGKLDVHEPVSSYLPGYLQGAQITAHQLLTHSAGVPNYTRRPDLAQVVQAPITLPELISQFSAQELEFPPGQRYAYSDSGYVLLTALIEAISGMSYAEFVQTEIFSPLGMLDSGYDFLNDDLAQPAQGYQMTPGGPRQAVETDSSWASGAGALYSTTHDLYRWEQALAGSRLLSAASEEAMFTPWVDMGQGYAYGYGWEIGEMAGHTSQTHAGNIFGYGSFIARFPQDEATIIVLGNALQLSPRVIAEDLARLLFNPGLSS